MFLVVERVSYLPAIIMSEFQYFLDCCVELDAVNLSVELDAVNLTATNLARSRLERSMRSCQPKKAGLGG